MPMNPRLVPIASLYQSSERLFEMSLAGLTREQGLARVGDANPLLWIAAHLATARYGLGQMIGVELARPWGTRFTRGSEVGELAAIPEADEIRAVWTSVSGALASRLVQLTNSELDAPAPRNFPIEDKSVLGGVAFLAYHEAYHIGQMALVRKALGLGGLVG
jgi:hypothetical protein